MLKDPIECKKEIFVSVISLYMLKTYTLEHQELKNVLERWRVRGTNVRL